jgi:hypothetical protein
MSSGFIKIDRKITEWGWWSDDTVFRFFVGIILLANFKDSVFKGKFVERGSFITSIPKLCAYFEMSERKVRRCLTSLKETGEIIDEANNHFRKITIINYNEYQDNLPLPKRKDNRQGNRKDKRKDNRQSNRDPIEERKKYKSPTDSCTEKAAPRAPDGRAPAAVTYQQMRRYQIDNAIGSGETVSEFYNGFVKSDTRFPENWQSVYTQYVRADFDAQIEFIERLQSGAYREKWGTADAGA